MNTKPLYRLLALLVVLSLSCIFDTKLTEVGGPANFTAEATSPVSVQLRWPADDGVEKYLLDVRIGDEDFIPLTELPAGQTSFEDFPVPRETELIYRLRKVTGSTTSDGETVTVTTPLATPNPITVKAKVYEPVVWTPPTVDPNNPNLDPSAFYPPGFDPSNPESFDPSSMMTTPSASEMIGPDGGSVTVISPDGMVYTLVVPEGAVEDSIIIKLTPIQSIEGLPLNGSMLAAVKIEPEGFILDAPATLIISTPDATPALPEGMYNVGFGFQGEGNEFHLVPQTVPSDKAGTNSTTGVKLASLSQGMNSKTSGEVAVNIGVDLINAGVARWPAEIVEIVKQNPPTDPGDVRAQDTAIIPVLDSRPVSPPRSDKSFNPAMLESAQSYLNRAGKVGSWSEFMSVMEDFQQFLEAGNDIPSMDAINNKIWDKLVDGAKNLLDKNQGKCFSTDDSQAQELADRLWNPKGKFSSTLSEKFILKYKEDYIKQMAENLVKKCKVTLKIASTISYQQDIFTLSATVNATIPLKWRFDRSAQRSFLSGSGPLKYTLFDMYGGGCSKPELNTKDGSTFTVSRLVPIYDSNVLVNFRMANYTIAGKQSSVTAHCPNGLAQGKTLGGAQGDVWGGLYVTSHAPDDMVVETWNMHSLDENIAAEKDFNWNKKPGLGGSGYVIENTTFTIVVGNK